MKKRNVKMIAGAALMACLLSGCVSAQKSETRIEETLAVKTDTETDSKSSSELAGDWELVEYTLNGEITKADDLLADVKAKAPAFRCDDGVNCVFSNNGKDHPGTITEKDGKYVITYDDTDQTMTAERSGDELTIVNSKGTLKFVFRAK